MSHRHSSYTYVWTSALALALGITAAGCANGSTGTTGAPSGTSAPAAAPTASSPSAAASGSPEAPPKRVTDAILTSAGELRITPIHHATFMMEFSGKTIHVDPWSEGKLDGLPKADLILITDVHYDHLDKAAIEKVKKPGAVLVGPAAVAAELPGATVLKNGESKVLLDIPVEAIPMYNKTRGPSEGKLFHDKGRGNGYVVTLGDKKVYISGDTECIDEMKALRGIDVAFLCMNLPYTMPPSEAAECVKAFRPKILYPYHFRNSKMEELTGALSGEQGIEVRLRSWY